MINGEERIQVEGIYAKVHICYKRLVCLRYPEQNSLYRGKKVGSKIGWYLILQDLVGHHKNQEFGGLLVVQWLRFCLPVKGVWVKTLPSNVGGCGFDPQSGSYDPTCRAVWPKKKKIRIFFSLFLLENLKAIKTMNYLSHNCFGSIFFVLSSFVLPNILFFPPNLLKVSSCSTDRLCC